MKLKATFLASNVDYFGYVAPTFMMREINEGIARRNFEDGVGFAHLFPAIGVTWMLGQCVLEFLKPVLCAEEVEMETGGHEQHGIATVRRSVMYCGGEEVMRFAAKLLPVDFKARKSVPPSVLEPFWRCPPDPMGEPIPFLCLPENMQTVEEYTVRYRDCDSNKHMTAFRYLDLILESAGYWDGELHPAERVQIDYKRECLPGDVLQLQHGLRDGVHYVRGVKQDGVESFSASVKLSETVYPTAKSINV